MSVPVALLFMVFPYVVWFGLVIGIIKLDQSARARRAAANPEPDATMFEDKSVTPYLLLSFICGALVLPVYFGSTRRNAGGFVLGIGAAVGCFIVTVVVMQIVQMIAFSIYHQRLW
jgi:hypothetical protein